MLAQWSDIFPWVSFVAGIGGSLHCVGMCGGLVTSSCENKMDIGHYQVGRLLGYLLLGAMAGLMGGLITLGDVHPTLTVIPSFIVGGLFIFWGFRSYQGKKAELPLPKFLQHAYQAMWRKVNRTFPQVTKAFFTGLISILLPCGLLYGVIAATVATQAPLAGMLGMFFFWLGTLPAMVAAPGLVRKILRPLQSHRPKIYAVSLMLVGVLTVGMRMMKQVNMSHAPDKNEKMSCH
ncbi:MAG: sulfite exporter TauE/SafE family protein [Bacteriovoracia bacterium]